MNRVEISGGLTRDPVIAQTGGYDRVDLTVAVNGTRWDSAAGAQVVKTAFIACVAWGPVAAECMSLKTGDEVYLVGELDQYRKEGKDQPSTRVTVFQMSMIREGRVHRAPTQPAGDDPWG